jgi:hypothetical protein
MAAALELLDPGAQPAEAEAACARLEQAVVVLQSSIADLAGASGPRAHAPGGAP